MNGDSVYRNRELIVTRNFVLDTHICIRYIFISSSDIAPQNPSRASSFPGPFTIALSNTVPNTGFFIFDAAGRRWPEPLYPDKHHFVALHSPSEFPFFTRSPLGFITGASRYFESFRLRFDLARRHPFLHPTHPIRSGFHHQLSHPTIFDPNRDSSNINRTREPPPPCRFPSIHHPQSHTLGWRPRHPHHLRRHREMEHRPRARPLLAFPPCWTRHHVHRPFPRAHILYTQRPGPR